jgi:hypothetical protein
MSDADPGAQAHSDDEIALSGLLDGELAPERAAALRLRIAAEPALRARWEAIMSDEARWRSMARVAQAPVAMPRLARAPRSDAVPLGWMAALLAALIAGRLLPKLLPLDLATALSLHGLLLAVALAAIALGARRLADYPG